MVHEIFDSLVDVVLGPKGKPRKFGVEYGMLKGVFEYFDGGINGGWWLNVESVIWYWKVKRRLKREREWVYKELKF